MRRASADHGTSSAGSAIDLEGPSGATLGNCPPDAVRLAWGAGGVSAIFGPAATRLSAPGSARLRRSTRRSGQARSTPGRADVGSSRQGGRNGPWSGCLLASASPARSKNDSGRPREKPSMPAVVFYSIGVTSPITPQAPLPPVPEVPAGL